MVIESPDKITNVECTWEAKGQFSKGNKGFEKKEGKFGRK